MSSDDLAEPEDCCVGEMSMDGDPNGMHAFDCPVYRRQSEALARSMDTRRLKSQPAAPVVDREALIRIGAAAITPAYGIAAIKKSTFVVDALLARGLVTTGQAQQPVSQIRLAERLRAMSYRGIPMSQREAMQVAGWVLSAFDVRLPVEEGGQGGTRG